MFIHWVWFTIQMASITRRKQKLQNIRNFRFKKKLFHKETRGMVRQLLQVSGEDWVAAVKEYVDNNVLWSSLVEGEDVETARHIGNTYGLALMQQLEKSIEAQTKPGEKISTCSTVTSVSSTITSVSFSSTTPSVSSPSTTPSVSSPLIRVEHFPRSTLTKATAIESSPEATITVSSPEATTPLLSPEATSTVFSPEATTTVFSPEATTTVFSPEATTTVFSPEATITVFSPEATTSVFSPEATTTVFSPEATTTVFSPEATASSPEATTTVSSFLITTIETDSRGRPTVVGPDRRRK
ncbi:integumentary mucin A.1-like isoform X2 [Homarus americanus]|uniref:integumentary mucin A.1-like isoform X2 n=1 Tax=Homarus americanus TaxID=6706 RepID=UPI001C486BD4|nr:integumentary mucin A.1-like isoform X2 [Homarus americanus]